MQRATLTYAELALNFPSSFSAELLPGHPSPDCITAGAAPPQVYSFAFAFSEFPDTSVSTFCLLVEVPLTGSPALQCMNIPDLVSSPPNDKDVFYPIVHTLDEDIEQYQSPRNTTCTWRPLDYLLTLSPAVQFFIYLVTYLSRQHFFKLDCENILGD